MRFAIGMLLAEAVFLTAPAAAQNPPTPPAIARTVVASTKLADVGASPLYFRALAVTIPPGETSKGSAPDGILYQRSPARPKSQQAVPAERSARGKRHLSPAAAARR